MTLASYLNSQFSLVQCLEFALRLVAAAACGAIIGIERSKRFKEAGIRTHIIVCLAAALIMIISKYSFADLTSETGLNFNGTRGADPARIAAQAVSGISFLGAGLIFNNGGSIKGLTTAAGVWATAGIGLAIGSGMYWLGIFATVFVSVIQMIFHSLKIGADGYKTNYIEVTVSDGSDFYKYFTNVVSGLEAEVVDMDIQRMTGKVKYCAHLKMKDTISVEELNSFFTDYPEIIGISNISK